MYPAESAAQAERATVTRTTTYDDLPEWLTPVEVASYLGCTPWSVYQNCRRGAIPFRRIGPKLMQIPKIFLHVREAQKQVTL
jgi:excisionase family DNA binding protein